MHFCIRGKKMVEFITGQAGSGKTTLMFERIKASAADGSRQCIIVPEQYSYEFDKTLYFYLGAERFNELFSLSFTSLARQLFQIYGDPDRNGEYADELARMILVYQAIGAVRGRPEQFVYFRRQSSHNGFAEEVLRLINDLKRSGVEPQQLLGKAALFDRQLMDKTSDIAAVYMEYERLMNEYGFKDELDNIKEAAKIANLHSYFRGRELYLDEFESFTGDQLEMLRVMIATADNVVITLRSDDVTAGEFTLFETVNTTYRRITDICRELRVEYKVTDCGGSYRFRHPDLGYLSSHIMRNFRYEPENAPKPENIRIFEARDMYSETEYVCATIKRLIAADSELKYRDIAIISNNIEEYADVLKAAFYRYGIPYFLSIEKPVAHTPLMVFFNTLLDLLTARKIRSEQVFRLLKCGILDVSLTETALLENYCYKWQVEDKMWSEPFTAPDSDLETIEALRVKAVVPVLAMRRKVWRKNTAGEICRLLYGYLEDCGADRNTARLMDRLILENRDHEAAELKRIWGCLTDILDSIYDTLGEQEIAFSELARMICSMTAKLTYSVPPQTLDSVIAASARTARLNSPKAVFVIGATEGDFPNQVSVHGLFSEADKQKLSISGIDVSRPLSDLIASERLIVYKSLSAASDRLYITYPLSDLSGQAKYPAQAVEQTMKMFGTTVMRQRSDELPPHYYAVTLHSAFYHYMQNYTSRSVSAASIKKVLMSEPEYRRRISYVLCRSGYTQDYKIASEVMQELISFAPLRLSSTSLEEFDLCHFKFFCDKCLRLSDIEQIGLDARVSGELTHNCFCGILGKRSKAEFISLSYDDINREIAAEAEKYRAEKLAGDFGKNTRFDLMFNKLKESLTNIFMHTQQSLMASDFTPVNYELDLREKAPVRLKFGEKYDLTFGGIIDRVDTCNIGGKDYVRILDYKSSRKSITPVTLGSGINLQMLLYLFAVTDKGGDYAGFQPAGVLYSPIRINDVKLEPRKVDSANTSALNSQLKTSGLVLSDLPVLDAMEKGIAGNYIPARLTKDGTFDRYSSCISAEGMEQLREFTYGKLTEMANSLLDGNAEAVPLVTGNELPCTFCAYGNICGNSQGGVCRVPDAESVARAEEILGKVSSEGGED